MSARTLATDPGAREAFVLERQDGAHAIRRRGTESGWGCEFPMGAFLAYCLASAALGIADWRWSAAPGAIVVMVLAALTRDELAGLLETPDTRVREAVLFELTRR